MNFRLDQLATYNKILEYQIASQASSSNFRQMGQFFSQPENLRKHVNTVTLRSGKQLLEVEHKIKDQILSQINYQKKERSQGVMSWIKSLRRQRHLVYHSLKGWAIQYLTSNFKRS